MENPQVIIIELTPENAESVVAPMVAYRDDVYTRLERLMTAEQAQQVKAWRVEGCTWGRIGELWAEAHQGYGTGDQILGKEACYRAATLIGDDPYNDPWN